MSFARETLADQLEDVVAGKKERGQKVSHLCVGHGGIGVGNLFEDCIAVIEDMMFLVIVAYVDIGSQTDMAFILAQKSVQDPEDRGLAGAVVSDHGHMLSPADVKTQSGEKRVPVEGLGQIFHCQHLPAAADTGGEFEMHVFHFAQHFLTALSALDGLFAVELSELGNDLLLMPDLGLVVEPGAPLLIAQGFLFFGVDGVIACEEGGGGVFDLDDLCDCAVEKIPVMGDNDNGSAVVGEIVFQPSDTAQIQVVGGLVEHDHIRALQKQACQGDTGLLAAGECRDLLVKLIVLESESAWN